MSAFRIALHNSQAPLSGWLMPCLSNAAKAPEDAQSRRPERVRAFSRKPGRGNHHVKVGPSFRGWVLRLSGPGLNGQASRAHVFHLNASRLASWMTAGSLTACMDRFNVTVLLASSAYLPILKSERLTVTVALALQVSALMAG